MMHVVWVNIYIELAQPLNLFEAFARMFLLVEALLPLIPKHNNRLASCNYI